MSTYRVEFGLDCAHVWTALHLGLDKTDEVFLIHAAGMMDMRVNLADIIEITGKCIRQ
jgi:hypothetical protein